MVLFRPKRAAKVLDRKKKKKQEIRGVKKREKITKMEREVTKQHILMDSSKCAVTFIKV